MDEKVYWYWLSRLPEISIKNYKLLIEIFGKPSEIYRQRKNKKLWDKISENINKDFLENVTKDADLKMLADSLHILQDNNIYFTTIDNNDYPNRLRELDNMPYFLYYKGELPNDDEPAVAIIGARKCSDYGAQAAVHFAEQLAHAGVQIISGLASGVDGYAHRGALKAGGKTFGVLGCGVDICYPSANRDIYDKMQQQGGIISEYCPGAQGLPYRFPMRNRIISALSDAIFVVEAGEKSGTLITVSYGLEQGRDIYALPGKVTDRLSCGCNRLIKDGAALIAGADDILHELEIKYPEKNFAKKSSEKSRTFEKKYKLLASDEKIVYSVLSLEPKHLEKLLTGTKIGVEQLLKALISLELKGLISQPTKDYYVINIK